jgi:hypothetical protein
MRQSDIPAKEIHIASFKPWSKKKLTPHKSTHVMAIRCPDNPDISSTSDKKVWHNSNQVAVAIIATPEDR